MFSINLSMPHCQGKTAYPQSTRTQATIWEYWSPYLNLHMGKSACGLNQTVGYIVSLNGSADKYYTLDIVSRMEWGR